MAAINGAVATLTPSTKRVREGEKVTFFLVTADDATADFDADGGDVTVTSTTSNAPTPIISAERAAPDAANDGKVFKFDVTFAQIDVSEIPYVVTVLAANVTGVATNLTVTINVFEHRQGRAERNPAAKNYGTNVLAIVAEQSDFFAPVVLPAQTVTGEHRIEYGVHSDLVELRPPYTLTPTRQFYEVMRLKGNPTPDPSIPGMVMGAGEMNFYLQPSALGFWFKHLLQANEVTSTKMNVPTTADGDIILAAGSTFSSNVISAFTKQPEELVAEIDNVPQKMRAAQIEITPSATAEGVKYRLTGTDNGDAPLEETSAVLPSGTGPWTSKQYFKTLTKIERIQPTSARAFTVTVKAKLSSTYRHTLKFDSDVSEGLSIEVQEGNKDAPIRYNGALVTRGIIRLE
ncbi:MAG: hypothetical protein OXI43_20105, partial [Candidatus Poribacteria bacterium]|nr:hypothetical protein [Candidatus Poribacteria bacterium]